MSTGPGLSPRALVLVWLLPGPALAQPCTQTLSPGAGVASALSSAQAGATICLGSGSHGAVTLGSFTKSPRVTLRSVTGQGATMSLSFSGTNGVTIDSVTVTGATLSGSTTRNITIQNTRFTGHVMFVDLANSNVLFVNNTHNNIDGGGQYSSPARLHLAYSKPTHSGVTIKSSVMDGGSADGVQTGVGVDIIGNVFSNIVEGSCSTCHTDAIQLLGAPDSVVRGNYIHDCATGIVAYDGVERATIEDNIVDTGGRPWAIELYSDDSSVVRHNTLLYRSSCAYNLPCGILSLTRKTQDDPGFGTIVVDNIATSIDVNMGSTYAERHHNLLRSGAQSGDITGTPTFTGGTTPTTITGFVLAAGSPGKGAAWSPAGSDIGARASVLSGCASASDCDDKDPCTKDSCDPKTGSCSNVTIPGCGQPDQGAGRVDGGTGDAGAADAGAPDSAPPVPDSGAGDDSGVEPPDLGPHGESGDHGLIHDAGRQQREAGPQSHGTDTSLDGGCTLAGAASSATAASFLLVFLLMLWLVCRR
jgi:hypothetical protein